MSAKAGLAYEPKLGSPRSIEVLAKAGLVALPVLRKKIVLPYSSPMKASRSPSPSMSAKAGLAK